MESAGGGWNVAAADGVRHPFGVPRLRWFRLQGFRCRSTACLWSCHPYGVYPARREGNRRLNERTKVVSTRE